ncbi:MAG TPA: hypothetical protein VJK02_05070 [Anaerolineales bacterium]|nr:hypothetical protein [Anaerolineales bacterium]
MNSPETLLPIDDFRALMGLHPWHFNGLVNGNLPVTSSCNDILRRYTWQGVDAVGRDEIQQAIDRAEALLAEWLGYNVAPRYEVITQRWQRFFDLSDVRVANIRAPWHRIGLQLGKGYIQKLGYQRRTALSVGAAITYSDEDGDSLNDTFTVSVATTVTDPDEIAVYFTSTERFDGSSIEDERWRIRPVKVTISGGTATIRGKRWLLVRPVLYEPANLGDIDPADTTKFPTLLDIYRLWIDPDGVVSDTSQAALLWETLPKHGTWCCCNTCAVTTPPNSFADPGAEARAVARVGIRDSRLGIVTPGEAILDTTTGIWSESTSWSAIKEPDRVTVRVLSGYPLSGGQVSPTMKQLVARLAAAELGRILPACEQARHQIAHWQFDLARTAGANDESYGLVAREDLLSPFGTKRGQMMAWKFVKQTRLAEGVAV